MARPTCTTGSRSSFKADILPVASTHLGPGSLAPSSAPLEGRRGPSGSTRARMAAAIALGNNRWYRLHLDLVTACKRLAQGRYFVGCPDLIEGMDTLAGLRDAGGAARYHGPPDELQQELQAVNDIWFEVFRPHLRRDQRRRRNGLCFSIWGRGARQAPERHSPIMMSPASSAIPSSPASQPAMPVARLLALHHLDGVGAMRHLGALLEIEELDAIQWTPGVGQPQGGDPCWYDLYRRILAGGKSIMPAWVEIDELQPLLDAVGLNGLNILMHFTSERDIDRALAIAEQYR